MKAITFNKENECAKQDGVAPADIIYAGRIEDISDSDLVSWGIGYNDLAHLLKAANGKDDEDSVMILTSNNKI